MSRTRPDAMLQELADREAIRDLACRYAHHVWQKQAAAAASLFTEDCEMDTGEPPVIRGRAALGETYKRVLGNGAFQPFVSNHVITLAGDEASGTCYLDLRATTDGRSMIGSGYYEDRYQRVDGEWKFRARKLHMSWLVPLEQGWADQAS
ncbi:MAG: nuclear transport factor 2 family protein [Deltaproteobacteria bacterium]|nr:nuclear transport factor 2 family protein [Deltaproteobacteria bacterium]MBW2392701.1 nuclear transport factor 2 family protein [Deltaproteobacteria bacterium]